MNKFIGTGHIVKKPELRYTNNNIPVANFTIAINRPYSQDNEADFLNCIAWKKTAELIDKYCDKGSHIGVEGEVQTRSYVDKTTNQKRYVTEIKCDRVEFLDSKKQEQKEEETPQGNTNNIEEYLPF